MNFIPMQNNSNKISHIAKYCRSKNSAPIDKNKSDEKRKEKFYVIIDQHKKMWVKKDEPSGSVLESGAEPSSDN